MIYTDVLQVCDKCGDINLYTNSDGDRQCLLCGKIFYKDVLPLVRGDKLVSGGRHTFKKRRITE